MIRPLAGDYHNNYMKAVYLSRPSQTTTTNLSYSLVIYLYLYEQVLYSDKKKKIHTYLQFDII